MRKGQRTVHRARSACNHWFTRLQREFGEVNLEGAFVEGESLTLLQRGNKSNPRNARVRIALAPLLDAIAKRRVVACTRELADVTDFELGAFDDAPLCFTDGATLCLPVDSCSLL